MNNETWRQLLSLESRDITQKWFNKIHNRELNARRAKEINSSARQAREYFRNAGNSNLSVKPLLTFYGVTSLSRALILLLRKSGGEECLTESHGLKTVGWGDILSGDIGSALEQLGNLKIRTTNGLFNDFLTTTNNRMSVHINSSAVDWRLAGGRPALKHEFTVDELFSRIPDLEKDYSNISDVKKFTPLNSLSKDGEHRISATVRAENFIQFSDVYRQFGYDIESDGANVKLSCTHEVFGSKPPMFMHTYILKTFGTIPNLYLVEPFSSEVRYSQLCMTYIVSYLLGMLVRYFPTYWISLTHGDKGDAMWPTINRAQELVEQSFPELVIELIHDVIDHPNC